MEHSATVSMSGQQLSDLTSANLEKFDHLAASLNYEREALASRKLSPPICINFEADNGSSETSSVTAPEDDENFDSAPIRKLLSRSNSGSSYSNSFPSTEFERLKAEFLLQKNENAPTSEKKESVTARCSDDTGILSQQSTSRGPECSESYDQFQSPTGIASSSLFNYQYPSERPALPLPRHPPQQHQPHHEDSDWSTGFYGVNTQQQYRVNAHPPAFTGDTYLYRHAEEGFVDQAPGSYTAGVANERSPTGRPYPMLKSQSDNRVGGGGPSTCASRPHPMLKSNSETRVLHNPVIGHPPRNISRPPSSASSTMTPTSTSSMTFTTNDFDNSWESPDGYLSVSHDRVTSGRPHPMVKSNSDNRVVGRPHPMLKSNSETRVLHGDSYLPSPRQRIPYGHGHSPYPRPPSSSSSSMTPTSMNSSMSFSSTDMEGGWEGYDVYPGGTERSSNGRPHPMIKSYSDNRVYQVQGGQPQQSANGRIVPRPRSSGAPVIPPSSFPRSDREMEFEDTRQGIYIQRMSTSWSGTASSQQQHASSAASPASVPPTQEYPLQVLSLDAAAAFRATDPSMESDRKAIFDLIEAAGVQVVLMSNTGLRDEEELRIVRNEVKAKYNMESAMWASFETPGNGRGVAVLILGPLAPRTGWIRSDSCGHVLSASSRVKPGLPVLSFVACDFSQEGEVSEEARARTVDALKEIINGEHEKGSFVIAAGNMLNCTRGTDESTEADILRSLKDSGVCGLKVGPAVEASNDLSVTADIIVSTHQSNDNGLYPEECISAKVLGTDVVSKDIKSDKRPCIVSVSVAGWPAEAFVLSRSSARSPDSSSPTRKTRRGLNKSTRRRDVTAPLPQNRSSHYTGGCPPSWVKDGAPSSASASPYTSPDMYQQYERKGDPIYSSSESVRTSLSLGHSDSITLVNDLLSWRMKIVEGFKRLDDILHMTHWGVVRLDQLKQLIQDVFKWVDATPHRTNTPGFADSASMSVLHSVYASPAEQLLRSAPDVLTQVFRTWHTMADHMIQRMSAI
mmetsp:Transcript_24921/g.36764  ORF Transcript_24921/g.36764 Transcript_24921/m.36764 type:complete len:1020 (-) Transcript_24921:344-3403(-)|eukprot:CAMPEP_0185026252 /NCGR_PEP_ID=MMETSP1103-20130426/10180_1 /TAXON_ID=36769 /ORGANISM="Paraphysomonas bandaiensis, Strain Caron Lab Isolate" /LENGTH=1019 /DNA_ID=CAMNT_0027559761 /DNA_START=80 /DNA_END=3139 /DNA_ORIENTATION=+